jgi:hypothetical protein
MQVAIGGGPLVESSDLPSRWVEFVLSWLAVLLVQFGPLAVALVAGHLQVQGHRSAHTAGRGSHAGRGVQEQQVGREGSACTAPSAAGRQRAGGRGGGASKVHLRVGRGLPRTETGGATFVLIRNMETVVVRNIKTTSKH